METDIVYRRHDSLIDSQEITYYLPYQEQRLILYLSNMVKKDDPVDKIYRINISDFSHEWGCKSHKVYDQYRLIAEGIQNRTVKIRQLTGNNKIRYITVNWLSYSEYVEGEGHIDVRFDRAMQPYFVELGKKYTEFKKKHILKLNNDYLFELYLLLKKYARIHERNNETKTFEKEVDYQDLRRILGLESKYNERGQKVVIYPKYGNVSQRILKPGQEIFRKTTDIAYEFHPKPKKRVKSIVFTITILDREVKKVEDSIEALSALRADPLYAVLVTEFGFQELKADEILQSYDHARIEGNLAIARERIKDAYGDPKKEDIKNFSLYLTKAIEEDWRTSASTLELELSQGRELRTRDQLQSEEEKKRKTRDDNIANQSDYFDKKLDQHINVSIKNYFDDLSEDERAKLCESFREYVENNQELPFDDSFTSKFIVTSLKNDDWYTNMFVIARLREFVSRRDDIEIDQSNFAMEAFKKTEGYTTDPTTGMVLKNGKLCEDFYR